MKYVLFSLSFLIFSSVHAQNNYRNAWTALDKNQKTEAELLLKKAMAEDAVAGDAYITNIYLSTYSGKESKITDFVTSFYNQSDNPYPYIYSLWFNQTVLGNYGKKTAVNQLDLLGKLIGDKRAPGSIVAAANYQKVLHLIFSAEVDKIAPNADAIGNVQGWQLTGPFENLSESGFFKSYGPLEHPEPSAVFKTATNADVSWFTPSDEVREGWLLLNNYFDEPGAVVYAQSFVNSPVDQTVLCNTGFTGAIKIWLNDELVISESKELATELDFLSTRVRLNKGTNRLLVQLSYSSPLIPNFNVRFTDDRHQVIPGIKGSPVFSSYSKNHSDFKVHEMVPHFVEKFFQQKIKMDSSNPVNYLLLTDFYLRNNELAEARSTISVPLGKYPHNSLLRSKLLEVLSKEKNRNLLLEELEKLKKDDPDCLLAMTIKISELYDNQKYSECEALLKKRIELYGEDETTAGRQILLLIADQKYDDLVQLAEDLYKKYPYNNKMVEWMYTIKKEVYQDRKAAFGIFEKYIKESFNYATYNKYADELIESGDARQGIAIKEKIVKQFPYSPDEPYNLSKYFYGTKQFDKSREYLSHALSLSPFSEKYWELSGDIQREQSHKADALKAYNRALELNPNQYNLINKIRKLNGLPEIYTLFGKTDILTEIENDRPEEAKNTDYGFYYILDKKDIVLYPGGANEEFSTVLVRITNEKGIERYKETSIGYDNSQTLLIENAQVVKPNNSRIEGEKNGNEIVFANVEVGDVIYLRYRLQSFATGRLAKEFWDKHYFTGQIYSKKVSYNILAPADKELHYLMTKNNLKPRISDVENFKLYSWVMDKAAPLEEETLMPLLSDVGAVLHISTMDSWDEITNWYSDALTDKSEENIEISSLYKTLFPDSTKYLTEYSKAQIIYNYIASNIKYSYVPFRQGPLIPQRASTTINTRLGDCKDLSNLFVTLSHLAGINSQLVLVDTRDNGAQDIMLPSLEFNHCIAKAILDNKPYYIELTDNYLPFGSLPNSLNGASILEIPSKSLSEKSKLTRLLNPANRTGDLIKRMVSIRIDQDDLQVSVQTVVTGALSSGLRNDFRNLSPEKQRQEMEQRTGKLYKSTLKMDHVQFANLENLDDSVSYSMNYVVKNETNEIGSIKTFKVIYPDIVATLDNFSPDERIFPVEYWSYENADQYITEVNISKPIGKKFIEIPRSESFRFGQMSYSLQYSLQSNGNLKIIRKFSNNRPQQISPEEYPAFKKFFEQILKSEQKFIACK